MDKKIELSDGRAITMREPKARDMMIAEEAGTLMMKQDVRLAANLCNMTDDEVLDLGLKDYKKIQEAMKDFLS